MDHFAPSNNIFMIDGHHAHRSPEYQGLPTSGRAPLLNWNLHVMSISSQIFGLYVYLYFIVLIGVSCFNGWFR